MDDKAVADARRRPANADRKKRKWKSVSVTSGGGGNTAVDVRVDAFLPANAPTSKVPQQSHTVMDLGRPISSALSAAHTVPPGGTLGPWRKTGNREGAGFKGRCFLYKNVGHKQSECSLPVCYACGQPGHYANARMQGRRASGNSQPANVPGNSQGVSRSVLANSEIGTLGYIGEGAVETRSQQSA